MQEIVDAEASLQVWFDKVLDFGHGSSIDAQLGKLPRIVTSRNQDKQYGDTQMLTKSEMAIITLLEVLIEDTRG